MRTFVAGDRIRWSSTEGTVKKATRNAVVAAVRYRGQHRDFELKFTLRKNGMYYPAGTPVSEGQPLHVQLPFEIGNIEKLITDYVYRFYSDNDGVSKDEKDIRNWAQDVAMNFEVLAEALADDKNALDGGGYAWWWNGTCWQSSDGSRVRKTLCELMAKHVDWYTNENVIQADVDDVVRYSIIPRPGNRGMHPQEEFETSKLGGDYGTS